LPQAKANFIKLFLPNYHPTENKNIFFRKGSEEEEKFFCAVTEQVEGLIIPTTFKLQLELDKQDETKTVSSLIEAKSKCDETLTATEATALAIHNITPSYQNNMEQHIKKLIDKAISKKLSTPLPPPPLLHLLPLHLPQRNEKTHMAAIYPNLCCQKTKGEKTTCHSDTMCQTVTTTQKKRKKQINLNKPQRSKSSQIKNNNRKPQEPQT
jgi:hypothetical protein